MNVELEFARFGNKVLGIKRTNIFCIVKESIPGEKTNRLGF